MFVFGWLRAASTWDLIWLIPPSVIGLLTVTKMPSSAGAGWAGAGAAALRVLRLPDNRVGDEGARSLARSPYLHHLTDLDLSDNPIHDPGAFALLNTTGLMRLRRLGLPRLGLTPKMRRALAGRYPG